MRNKKFAFMILMIFLISTILAGCGGSTNESTSGEQTKEKTETAKQSQDVKNSEAVKLVIWGGVPEESGPQALVEAWNSEHPDIQVEYVRFVNDETGNTKLDTALLSGEQIDIFFSYAAPYIKKRADSGMIEPLENFGAEDFIKENVVGAGEGILYVDDILYTIPTAREPFGMMFNKTMLDEAGISIPDDWTIEDFKNIAAKLTTEKDGKKIYGTHVYYSELPLNFAETVLGGDHFYKEGGKESNFDDPAFKYNLVAKELMDAGYAMPYEEVSTRKLEAYSHPAYLNGEIAMMPFSAWMLRYVKDLENFPHDFVSYFASYPRPEKDVDNYYTAYLNNWLCMNSKSEHKQEAWEFMKYWVTEGSKYMLNGGKIPVWNKADMDEVTAGILGDDAEKLFDVESYKKVMLNPEIRYIVDTQSTAYPQIRQIWVEESQKLFLNAETEEEYLNNLKTRADEAIKAELGE